MYAPGQDAAKGPCGLFDQTCREKKYVMASFLQRAGFDGRQQAPT